MPTTSPDDLASMQERLLKLRREQAKDLARTSLAGFVPWITKDYELHWYHRELGKIGDRLVDGTLKRVIINIPPRHGKLLADDTPVLTPDGSFVNHGDLQVGDRIFGLQEIVEVVAVSSPGEATLEVVLSDGSSVIAHPNHEWTLEDRFLTRITLCTWEIRVLLQFGTLPPLPERSRVQRQIVAVHEVLAKPGKCIQVSSADGLYLVGKSFIPTHNSEMISRHLPAYFLGRFPDRSVIAASYNADLASSFNRDVQRVMDSPAYQELFPDSRLAANNSRSVSGKALRNADVFEIVGRRGRYRSSGVGGTLTGAGSHLLLLDDPLRGVDEARSPLQRERAWEWFNQTFMTRQAPGGTAVALIMTRWHIDDIAGRLLKQMEEDPDSDRWEVIRIPAIREDDTDPADPREIGEALWPSKYGLDYLQKIRAGMGEAAFQSLYQQRPTIPGGALFKEFRWTYWYTRDAEPPPVMAYDDRGRLVPCKQERLPTKFQRVFQSWDMAFKGTDSSDWVVGQAWGQQKAMFYLLDQYRKRSDFTATLAAVRAFTEKHPRALKKLIEDKANGPAVVTSLRREIAGIDAVTPLGGKESRANAMAPVQESGNVVIPHPSECAWVTQFVAECAQFPRGPHDDQVDSMTQAVNWAQGRKKCSHVVIVSG